MEKNANENFITHFLTIGMGTFINMILGLISTPIITRIVDPYEYGQLSIFTMYTGIAVMVLCVGLDQALIRYYYDKDTITYKRALLRICVMLPAVATLICSGIVLFLSYRKCIEFEFQPFVMLLLCLNVFFSIWSRIAVLLLRITYQSKKYAKANIIMKVVYIIIAILGIKIIKRNYLIVLCVATVASYVFQAVYATCSTKEMWFFSEIEDIDNKKEIIKYGMPFILSMGITTVFQALDKISLNHFCSYNDVGVYSSAISLVNIFAIIQTTFNSIWGPMQIEHYVKNPQDRSFIQKGNRYITIIMFFMGFSLIFVKDIFALLLGEKYRLSAYILPFLIFNPIMYTISETTCSGISISKKTYLNIWVSAGACLTNLIGNTLLVPRLGCQGAAISTGVSYIVFYGLRTFFSNKYYYVDYAIKKITVVILFAIAYAGYNSFFSFSIVSIIGYVICIAVLGVLYCKEIKEGYAVIRQKISRKFVK